MRDYPHTTDTERFHSLHDAADALLDQLNARFMVERREGKEPIGPEGALVRTVRLVPHSPAAAPLSLSFTGCPGLLLRLGRWWSETLPECDCPECAEDPDTLVATLRLQAACLVEGGLWEQVRRGMTGSWFETRLIGDGFRQVREGSLSAQAARDARRGGFAAAVQWAPWARRP